MSIEMPLSDEKLRRIERAASDLCSWDDTKVLLVEVRRLRVENAQLLEALETAMQYVTDIAVRHDLVRALKTTLVKRAVAAEQRIKELEAQIVRICDEGP